MTNPFNTRDMAAGYARSRPPVHPHIIERLRTLLGRNAPVDRALDVGCGAGLSTAALTPVALRPMGIDPSPIMVSHARDIAPAAHFLVGVAESLPLCDRSIELMTAAGSLNWVDLPRSLNEAARVLSPGGKLAIYDFGAGCELRDDGRLSSWYAELLRRYPSPPCRAIVPEALDLAPHGLRLEAHETIVVGLELEPGFYLDYVMTETNIAEAVRNGSSPRAIRDWCRESLAAIFPDRREVLFRAYLALVGRSRT
jgi:SAM-dependent methyltransferase